MRMLSVLLLALGTATTAAAQTPAAPQPATQAPPSGGGAPFAREIAAYAAQDEAGLPPKCSVLFVGSSTIRRWNSLVADFRPTPVINRGFGGAQIAHVNRYFDETVGRYQPRAIVFYAGDNDINAGKTPEEVLAEFERFLQLKTERLGETPVYVISAKPSPVRMDDIPRQKVFNGYLKALADRRPDLVYIDVFDAMMQPDGQPKPVFFDDRLHMSSEGYFLWIPRVKAALERPAPTRAPGC